MSCKKRDTKLLLSSVIVKNSWADVLAPPAFLVQKAMGVDVKKSPRSQTISLLLILFCLFGISGDTNGQNKPAFRLEWLEWGTSQGFLCADKKRLSLACLGFGIVPRNGPLVHWGRGGRQAGRQCVPPRSLQTVGQSEANGTSSQLRLKHAKHLRGLFLALWPRPLQPWTPALCRAPWLTAFRLRGQSQRRSQWDAGRERGQQGKGEGTERLVGLLVVR